MRNFSKILGLLIALVCFQSSCQKEQIAPANQEVAFIKYFGHIGDQKASDVVKTADGGYIMVGATNSYSGNVESDVFIVKTDALGNEVWSTSLGKKDALGTGASVGKFVRYDEEGIKIIELPGAAGYVVASNRSYYHYATELSTDRVLFKTKIVIHQLDPAGVPLLVDGVELRTTTNNTEKVSDMKIDTTGGILNYILTGYTTQVDINPVNKPIVGPNDKTDIFAMLLDESFNFLWSPLNMVYGFDGEDYGASVQILSDAYVIIGTTEEKYTINNDNRYVPRIIAVKMAKFNGIPFNPSYLVVDASYSCEGGYSVYDPINQRITITGAVVDGVNSHLGHAFLVQVDQDLKPQTTGFLQGAKFFKPKAATKFPLVGSSESFSPKSIAMLPSSGDFLVSMTYQKSQTEYNVAVMKVNSTLLKEDWTYFFGYEDLASSTKAQDQEVAGTVIPVINQVTANQSELKGYVVTGTFHVGTNNMMGLIKMNLNGELKP